jgi:DMSO/TMAO reductase YedYZ molybdopterin-dependent catalytic subunit
MHDRVPAGQYVTPKMPVMNLSYAPQKSTAEWRLSVTGLVDNEMVLTWEDFLALAPIDEVVDFHCVTQWSRLDVAWEGVAAATVLDLAGPKPEARYAMIHGQDGYTTNVDLAMLREPEVLFAH